MTNIDRIKSILEKVYGKYGTISGSGLWSPKPFADNKSRYLWTDAYGVIDFLNLFCLTQNEQYVNQARILIDSVHNTLGKNRDGKTRLGQSTEIQPTLGGLRIGKPENEGPSMDQDGQYYHYLTKWMFALNRMTFVTKDQKYNRWAVDLVKSVHPHFVEKSDQGKPIRMFWKMSIDLSGPLVRSMGGLDPYDGYTTYKIVAKSAENPSVLDSEISDMKVFVDNLYESYSTRDSLDAGEALWLSSWFPEELWAKRGFKVATNCVNHLWENGEFEGSQRHRLAFREFGTTIGVQIHSELMTKHNWSKRVEKLNEFWLPNLYERDCDITPVMYCASLFPGLLDPNFTI